MSGAPSPTLSADRIRYLALGDSYTIGTGASREANNYPSIVAQRVAKATGRKVDLTNPAVNGFTTTDLIDRELRYVQTLKPQLVSILIGVNDLVQGRTPDQYRASLQRIYDAVVALDLPDGQVAAISIPSWSVVPAARDFGDPERLQSITDAFNAIANEEASSRGFTWIDITDVSTSGAGADGWISDDRLHPGDSQYGAWADVIWETVRDSWVRAASRRMS
jgi:lysophospholipase L1-like esterase